VNFSGSADFTTTYQYPYPNGVDYTGSITNKRRIRLPLNLSGMASSMAILPLHLAEPLLGKELYRMWSRIPTGA